MLTGTHQPPSNRTGERLKISSASASDAGPVRKHNEDFCASDIDRGCFVLSDGMGGGPDGRAASELVCSVMLAKRARGDDWHAAVKTAHLGLRVESRKRNGTRDAGATVVALAIEGDRYDLVWVGDSRIYLWNDGLTLLTRDHSIVQGLLASGAIQPEDIASHPYRHSLTQVLGKTDPEKLEPECMSGRVYPGDRFVLCSDGLCDSVPESRLSAILDRYLDTQQAVRALMDAALDAGAEDNVSVLIVDVL
jgi:protein phosphatase